MSSSLGCQHYRRNCALVSPCCQKVFTCRFCHDEEYFPKKGCQVQRMERHKVSTVKCLSCEKIQNISNKCEGCGLQFGQYYCAVCRFFDNDLSKDIYHCDKCGICRVGKKNSFHCDSCQQCIALSLKEEHICKEVDKEQDKCPICLEEFFYSRKS